MSTTMNVPKREHDEESSTTRRQMLEKKISCRVSNILELPNDILKSIILYLNARERVPLGKACQKFKTLVFEDEELLRDLDFSQNAHLTSATDIQQYFENANTHKCLRRLNMRNVKCIKAGYRFDDSIGKALNLVEINMHGIKFRDIWQLGTSVSPLLHLQKLSLDWPVFNESHILSYNFLQRPFSRLRYLSVKFRVVDHLKEFMPGLLLCQELHELHVVVDTDIYQQNTPKWEKEPDTLKNLKIIEYCGRRANQVNELFRPLMTRTYNIMHVELNIEVCAELRDIYCIRESSTAENRSKFGFEFFPELLLNAVLKINYINVPAEFCCLSTFRQRERFLLKIDDAKRLMKNPRYQISYLNINHPIEIGCDVHLVASAFPNLTKLVLSGISRNLDSFPRDAHFERRLKARTGTAVEEHKKAALHMDSSFKMLMENTPHLKHFTLHGGSVGCENWDLDALYVILGWKRLETLCLRSIPIEDGHFLIEIGKRCKNLKKLELMDLGTSASRYERELLHMLKHCRNLTDFSIDDKHLKIPELFAALVSTAQLKRVCAKSRCYECGDSNCLSAIKELLRQCSKLTILRCECEVRTVNARSSESINVDRLKRGSHRPNLQILVIWKRGTYFQKDGIIYEDIPHAEPFPME